jgi:hypothetical protein
MGLAGFSHDFGALAGQRSLLRELFDAFATSPLSLASILVLLTAPAIPVLSRVPTQRAQLRDRFSAQSGVLARQLLAKTAEAEGTIQSDDRSILGLLSTCAHTKHASVPFDRIIVRAQTAHTGFPLTEGEVNDQVCSRVAAYAAILLTTGSR